MSTHRTKTSLLALLAMLAMPADNAPAQQSKAPDSSAAAASHIADFFSKVGDQIYEDCIFELSQEQLEVQQALVLAYVKQGATNATARRLAVKQITLPKLSSDCERIKGLPRPAPPVAAAPPVPAPPPPVAAVTPPPVAKKPVFAAQPKLPPEPPPAATATILASKQVLPQWDCAPGVDYVTIQHNGYQRKLTGGEICNPFQDVVRELPPSAQGFKLGYTIKTGRMFVISEDPQISGKTIAWAISGREVCRNNPDPDCLAARAIGPLPPGEYSFSTDKAQRVSWGPKTKRAVAGIYLTKLANKERYTAAQTAAIMSRGNIAIHARLKGEMSEACLGLEPNGWAYVAALIKDMRATALTVYIDEPYPQIAEAAPVIIASSFSLTSLFK